MSAYLSRNKRRQVYVGLNFKMPGKAKLLFRQLGVDPYDLNSHFKEKGIRMQIQLKSGRAEKRKSNNFYIQQNAFEKNHSKIWSNKLCVFLVFNLNLHPTRLQYLIVKTKMSSCSIKHTFLICSLPDSYQ